MIANVLAVIVREDIGLSLRAFRHDPDMGRGHAVDLPPERSLPGIFGRSWIYCVMPILTSAVSSRRGMFAALVAVLILSAAGIGWYVHAAGTANADTPSAASTDASGESILLGLAKVAVSEHRLVAPAGNNAYEFYFSALQLDPANASVHKQLNRLFERACDDLEQTINARDIEEAQRELALLRDYDSNNYKLALLASKLSAQRMVMMREHEAQAAAIQARAENSLR